MCFLCEMYNNNKALHAKGKKERTISKKLKDFWFMFVFQNNTSVIYMHVEFKFPHICN